MKSTRSILRNLSSLDSWTRKFSILEQVRRLLPVCVVLNECPRQSSNQIQNRGPPNIVWWTSGGSTDHLLGATGLDSRPTTNHYGSEDSIDLNEVFMKFTYLVITMKIFILNINNAFVQINLFEKKMTIF